MDEESDEDAEWECEGLRCKWTSVEVSLVLSCVACRRVMCRRGVSARGQEAKRDGTVDSRQRAAKGKAQ